MRGGGVGAGYSVGPAVLVPGMPYLVNDGSVGNCQAVAPGYALSASTASALQLGLPGMRGGGHPVPSTKRRRGRRTMRGGRYDGVPMAYPGPNVGVTPMATRIPCEAGQGTPQPSPTVPTEPPVAAMPAADMPTQSASNGILPGYSAFGGRRRRSSRRRRMRGGALLAPYSGSPVLQETTAGYTHLRSGSDFEPNTQSGVPFMFNVPDGGRLGVPNACVTLGGGSMNPNLGNTGMRGGGRRRRRSHRRSHRGRR